MRVQKFYSDGCKKTHFFSNLKFNRKHSLFFNISVRVRFSFILRYKINVYYYNNLKFNKYTMYITQILFLIVILGFILARKHIISHTIKFLILVSYKSVDLIGPTFKLISEGLFILTVSLSLSRFIVSNFFGRETRVSGAQFITCFSVIVNTILAVIAFSGVVFNNISVLIELLICIANKRFNTIYAFEFNNFGTNKNVNYILNNKAYFSTSSLNLRDSKNLKPSVVYQNADLSKNEIIQENKNK